MGRPLSQALSRAFSRLLNRPLTTTADDNPNPRIPGVAFLGAQAWA